MSKTTRASVDLTDDEMYCHAHDCGGIIRLDNNDTWLPCGKCEATFHAKCVTIAPAIAKEITKNPGKVFWFCQECNPIVVKLLKGIDETKARCDDLETKYTAIEQKISELADKIENTTTSNNNINANPADGANGNNMVEKAAELAVERAVFEFQDLERRKHNLLIFNLKPQSDSNEQLDDVQLFSQLLLAIKLDPADFTVSYLSRVGGTSGDKPRALKISFPSKTAAGTILANARNLENCTDQRFAKISIKPDRTPTEQAKEKAAYEEFKRRKTAGDKNIRLRGTRIITVDPRKKTGQSQAFLPRTFYPTQGPGSSQFPTAATVANPPQPEAGRPAPRLINLA